MEGMGQRLSRDTLADFYIQQADHKQEFALSKMLQLATEYGFTSHLKDFGTFLPSCFYEITVNLCSPD